MIALNFVILFVSVMALLKAVFHPPEPSPERAWGDLEV